jgi:hypothetical protein
MAKMSNISTVTRPETEDDDTEQKLINEGTLLYATYENPTNQLWQSTKHGRRTAPSSMI